MPIVSREEGTLIVPGHGRLYDQYDVVEYRDMVTIIRDRVRDLRDGRPVARRGQGGQPGEGLRRPLRQRRWRLDDGPLRRSHLPQPHRRRNGDGAGRSDAGPGVLAGRAGARAASASAQPPPPAREAAPIDLTGYWVSYVTENWRYRMVTPAKGEYRRIPASPGRAAAHQRLGPGRGRECRTTSASPTAPAAIMNVPGRLHITWQDANTLRIDTDAGTQTRLLPVSPPRPSGRRKAGALPRGRATRPRAGSRRKDGGSLRVVTSNLRAGYLRKNGVPYSERATVTEHFDLARSPRAGQLLLVTTVVNDPVYLTRAVRRRARTSRRSRTARSGTQRHAHPPGSAPHRARPPASSSCPARDARRRSSIFTGSWAPFATEDVQNDSLPVDYLGLALTDEGRTRALSYDESQKSMIERQCQGWGATYAVLGPFGLVASTQIDPATKRVVSYTIDSWEDWNGLTIWMDGRPHPSAYALHTQEGFTTGRWEGNALAARTTHMKAGWIRKTGVPLTDEATLDWRFVRHDDVITVVMIARDPVYLVEPAIVSKSFRLSPAPARLSHAMRAGLRGPRARRQRPALPARQEPVRRRIRPVL